MAKETKKEKWQRIAKSQNVKHQSNDTIIMLVVAVAHTVGVDPSILKGKQLEVAIEKAIEKKVNKTETPKALETPKTEVKKEENTSETKKDVKIESKKQKTVEITIPTFKDIPEMKVFCVSNGLNRVEGYILETKNSKAIFLKWIKANIDKAVTVVKPIKNNENPHSPHSGIGEMDNQKNSTTENGDKSPDKGRVFETPKINVPELSTGSNINEMPTALSEMNKMFKPDHSDKKEVKTETTKNKSAQMRLYGNSIIDALQLAPMFRINGGIKMSELKLTLSTSSKEYEYSVLSDDDGGSFLMLSDDDGNKCRIPRRGALPMV